MSRSGYSEDLDNNWDLIRWRGAVNAAIKGKRGQEFLQETLDALDAMEKKELIACEIIAQDGACCLLGAVAKKRNLDVAGIDPEWPEDVALKFGIARAMASEIVYENDEGAWNNSKETPSERWVRMRKWVCDQLAKEEKK